METVTTSKGKTFKTDLVLESGTSHRLYVHIIDSTLGEVVAAMTTELPLKEHPAYDTFDGINTTPSGVNVCLKKGES